jgi:hypothetical protein
VEVTGQLESRTHILGTRGQKEEVLDRDVSDKAVTGLCYLGKKTNMCMKLFLFE